MTYACHALLCQDVFAPDEDAISISSREHVTGEIGDIVAWPRSEAASYDALCAENDIFSESLEQVLFLLEGGIGHDEPSLPARVKAPIVALAPWQSDDFFFGLCDRESISRYAIDAPQGLEGFFSLIATQLHQLIIQASHWLHARPLQGLSLEDRRILIGLAQPFERTELWCTQFSNRLCTLFADGGIPITEPLRTACGIFLFEQTTALREIAAPGAQTSLVALR